MRKTVELFGVNIDAVNMEKAVALLKDFCNEDRVHPVYTANSEMIMAASKDSQFKDILNAGDMVTADGAGVILASKILGLDLPQKVSGIDLVRAMLPVAAQARIPFYLLGGKPGVARDAARNMERDYPGLDIRGYSHGYFTAGEEKDIIDDINRSGALILLVALGAPRQENWIHKNRDILKPRVCIGVGGTLDVFSGRTKPTPEFIRRWGFEWLHRLCKEPWRYKRMRVLPVFVIKVIMERIRSVFR